MFEMEASSTISGVCSVSTLVDKNLAKVFASKESWRSGRLFGIELYFNETSYLLVGCTPDPPTHLSMQSSHGGRLSKGMTSSWLTEEEEEQTKGEAANGSCRWPGKKAAVAEVMADRGGFFRMPFSGGLGRVEEEGGEGCCK